MIASAALFFGSLWGRVALGAGIVVALMVVRAMDVSKQRAIGEDRAVAKIEKATDNATKLGTAAAAKSVSGGCGGSATPLPGTIKILDGLPRVQNSPKAPCWQQEQIAAQNSFIESVKAGKELVYIAPCKIDTKQDAASRVANKT